MRMYCAKNHTYVVCAYGDSPFLSECLDSLNVQSVSSNISIATSTPSKYIEELATKYNCALYVREGDSNIADDWNFAVSVAETPLVTLAHQDDIYCRDYTERMLDKVNSCSDALLYFSNYGELRGDHVIDVSRLLTIKRFLLKPLTYSKMRALKAVKRRTLSLGNPICCPAVTFLVDRLPSPLFRKGFRSNLDWDAWERFSRQSGSFVYDAKICMYHRVHGGSETSACIVDNTRTNEDLEMLKKFWPSCMARLINRLYISAQSSN